MSLRNLGKLFKISKKNEKSENEEISLPIEGFEHCILLLLAYSGQNVSELSISDNYKCEKKSDRNCTCVAKRQTPGTAVLRYLGRCHGLSGADPFEDLEIDQIVDAFHDFIIKIFTLEREQDPVLKKNQVSNFNESEALAYLSKFDAVIAANKGHLALSKLTWADFLVAGMWEHIKGVLQIDGDNKFPNIKTMVDNIMSIPSIKMSLDKAKIHKG